MRTLHFVLAILSLIPISALGAPISLSAESGKFNAKTLGPHTAKAIITATVQVTEFRGAKAWPAGAYVGFHEGEDRSNSVQFVLMRNTDTDTQLAIGYRVLKDGKEQIIQFIEWAPLDAHVKVTLSFENGIAMLRVGDGELIKIKTSLQKVAPYASVSSSSASFDVSP